MVPKQINDLAIMYIPRVSFVFLTVLQSSGSWDRICKEDMKDVYFFRIFTELHFMGFYGKFTDFYSSENVIGGEKLLYGDRLETNDQFLHNFATYNLI